MTRGFAALLAVVLLAGISALAGATDGFRVVTSDGARELAIERSPRPVPDVSLVDQDGKVFSLGSYRGRRVLIEFIYTRCPTVCGELGDTFQHMLSEREKVAPNQGPDLLSISFDPKNDDTQALKYYGERFGAASPRWRIAKPLDRQGLARLLDTFGVVVIPDGMDGFVHNTAVYLVDRRSRLIRILDPHTPPRQIAAIARNASAP
jgi:protein SCO1/2